MLVVGDTAKIVTDSTLVVRLGFTTQFEALRLSAVVENVVSLPVPATRKPLVSRLVVIGTVAPASPVALPTLMFTATGVLVMVGVLVGVFVGVAVGVLVAVAVGVLVGVAVGVFVGVKVGV